MKKATRSRFLAAFFRKIGSYNVAIRVLADVKHYVGAKA